MAQICIFYILDKLFQSISFRNKIFKFAKAKLMQVNLANFIWVFLKVLNSWNIMYESAFVCSGWKHHHWSFVNTTYLFQAFTIIFPTLFPVNNPKNASGIFSKPSTIVSWVLIFPSFTHCAIWVMPSFQRFAHLETMKPSNLSCWN